MAGIGCSSGASGRVVSPKFCSIGGARGGENSSPLSFLLHLLRIPAFIDAAIAQPFQLRSVSESCVMAAILARFNADNVLMSPDDDFATRQHRRR